MKTRITLTLSALAGLITSLALAQSTTTPPTPPPSWQIGSGFDYSRGDYGFNEDTEVFSVPLLLNYESPQWIFRFNVPYLTLKGPAAVVGSGSGIGGGSARPTRKSESGLGDIFGSATYRPGPILNGLNVDFTARLKLPTASEDKGLGTGKADLYTQVDLYKTFGQLTPFGSIGYRFLGNSTRYPLEDGFYVSGGAFVALNDATRVGALLDWREKLIAGGDDATELLGFVTHRINERWDIFAYALHGFTDASPDFGLGGSLTYRF